MSQGKRTIIANVERLHALMDRDGLAAVVVRSGKNFTYLAGFALPGTLARHLDFADSPREVLLVWPRRGEPVLVLNEFVAPLARRDSWVTRIEELPGYGESPYARAAAALKEQGLADERIGFEKAAISAANWEQLGPLLPRAAIADCSRLMDEVRWIKTPGEVALLREAADLLDEALLEVFPTVREGETEHAVHGRIVNVCLQRGAGWVHGILNSSRNTVMYGGEGELAFRRGDVIRNDYVSYLRGYPGHQSRTVVLGRPSDEQRRTYATVRDVYRSTIEQCRPGARAEDIYRFAAEAFAGKGFADRLTIAGHGVGAWWHQQPPYLVPGSDGVLEAGMVIATEPHVGYWHLQDMILITDDGPVLLSARFNTDEMLVVGD